MDSYMLITKKPLGMGCK